MRAAHQSQDGPPQINAMLAREGHEAMPASSIMASEIREQPQVLERILREGQEDIRAVARSVMARAPHLVLFLARGSSAHAAIYASYLVQIRLALPTGFVSPSTYTLYGAIPDLRHTLVIAVSQSGASPDLVESLCRARSTGAITIAITNDAESSLAEAAEYHLFLRAGEERAVTATKTYTAELLTVYCLVEALGDRFPGEADSLPQRAEDALAHEQKIAAIAEHYIGAPYFLTTARGYNDATARELALKLMETSYVVTTGLSSAELLHGPIAMISPGFPVIAIVPPGPGGATIQPVVQRLRESGADLMIVGSTNERNGGNQHISLPNLGPEILTPILLALPLQQFAWHLALARGNDPDQPRGIQKLTRTW